MSGKLLYDQKLPLSMKITESGTNAKRICIGMDYNCINGRIKPRFGPCTNMLISITGYLEGEAK